MSQLLTTITNYNHTILSFCATSNLLPSGKNEIAISLFCFPNNDNDFFKYFIQPPHERVKRVMK